jgi:hypothetical protein
MPSRWVHKRGERRGLEIETGEAVAEWGRRRHRGKAGAVTLAGQKNGTGTGPSPALPRACSLARPCRPGPKIRPLAVFFGMQVGGLLLQLTSLTPWAG